MLSFWFILHLLMVVTDVAWWAVTFRLTRARIWRILISAFLGAQLAAHLSLMCGLDWPRAVPKIVLEAVIVWHFVALGVLFSLALMLAVRRLARRLRKSARGAGNLPSVVPFNESALKRREFIGACAAFAPPLFTIGLTAVAQAQLNQLRVRRFTLPIAALPRALDGITIAQLSDMHIGGMTSGRVLRAMVKLTNELRPDLVLHTGDLINYSLDDLGEALALVKSMEGRFGQWMIEGNHDLFQNGGEFAQRVRAAGVRLLLDESDVASVRGQPVQLFGLRWRGGPYLHNQKRDQMIAIQLRESMKQRQADAFPILLAHHPHAFDAAVAADLPLTLAGHTHGGFWMLDRELGIGPTLFRYWSGHYKRGGSQMIVSNGIGNWVSVPSIRINAPAEIVHITLRCV